MTEPKKWTPADPLEDAEDEQEVQREARARTRLKYLQENEFAIKPAPAPGKKPRKGLFSSD
jgi:hypothetical protein